MMRRMARGKKVYRLRTHRPGDLGWIVQRHGELYAQEYGYDERFEGVVAEVAGQFLAHHDRRRERCWIAEKDGQRAGCVMLVKKSAAVAKLRVLLVEPEARGAGLGMRLIQACVRFARRAGYRKITLWTHRSLTAARRLYERAGFHMVSAHPIHSFGRDLVDEIWELRLR
jgi:GNAT superfamily N-acetyltransferase